MKSRVEYEREELSGSRAEGARASADQIADYVAELHGISEEDQGTRDALADAAMWAWWEVDHKPIDKRSERRLAPGARLFWGAFTVASFAFLTAAFVSIL